MEEKNPELRRDLVSGDWILIAPKRGKRPEELAEAIEIKRSDPETCPFCHLDPAAAIVRSGEGDDWRVLVIANKYPAVNTEGPEPVAAPHGPYSVIPGYGMHDVIVTRDHDANYPRLSPEDAFAVFKTFQERYRMLAEHDKIAYASIFHNWGPKAGASLYHPHYQMLSIPVVPPDVHHSLDGSSRYFTENEKCVHCVEVEWEKHHGTRVIYENERAVAFAPFISREPFELRVFPKEHLPYFEDSSDEVLRDVADALTVSLKKLEKGLKQPHYNFFLHTAPIKAKEAYGHYHWHLEVQPKLNISAGFELSTGIEINTIDPNDAAEFLRSIEI